MFMLNLCRKAKIYFILFFSQIPVPCTFDFNFQPTYRMRRWQQKCPTQGRVGRLCTSVGISEFIRVYLCNTHNFRYIVLFGHSNRSVPNKEVGTGQNICRPFFIKKIPRRPLGKFLCKSSVSSDTGYPASNFLLAHNSVF